MDDDIPPTIVGGNGGNSSGFVSRNLLSDLNAGGDSDCSVRVALRVRPLSLKEVNERSEEVVRYVDGVPQVIIGKDQTFTFDYVFSGKSKQHQVYDDCVTSLVNSIFQGYNSTILAYGQTGSGKTYTMGSTSTVGVPTDELGVIPRVIAGVFEKIDRLKSTHDIVVKVSFLELYNEEIRDMLNPDASVGGLSIREMSSGEVHIPGLFEEVVRTRAQMEDALIRGSQSRTIGSTLMNLTSSRSHAIFTVIIEQTILDQNNEENNISEERNPTIRSKFHFVDLAGSERVKKTKAEGQRLKEGININSGLLALGNVISALGDTRRTAKPKHVPYRDSKLTRMLQSSLGGNSRTLMIACISPADSNFEETLNTLKYAYRARNIMNKPVVNVDPLTKQINMYKGQIQILRDELVKMNYKESDIDALIQDVDVSSMPIHEESVIGSGNNGSKANGKNAGSGGAGSGGSTVNGDIPKKEPMTPSRMAAQASFEDNMKVSQLEFENNMLQEISNKITNKYKVLLGKYKQLEEASYGFINSFSPNKESGEYLDVFNSFQKILVEPKDENTQQSQAEDASVVDGNVSVSANAPGASEDDITILEDIENVKELMDDNEKLSDLNDYIVAKEEELELIAKSQMQYQQMKEMYDSRLKELEVQLMEMKEDRENAMRSLEEKKKTVDGSSGDAASAIEEEKLRLTNFYERKLSELKKQLDQHTRSIKDHQRLMDLKSKSDDKIIDLTEDIKDLKRQKSEVLKKMRDELKKRDDQKQSQTKELEALKKEAKKSEQLIGQLMNQSKKKDQLLQKKIDESEQFKKKLKDLESHKQRVIQNKPTAASSSSNNNANSKTSNNSGFRSKTAQAVPAPASVPAAVVPVHGHAHLGVTDWRDWLLEQIRKNLSKNELTETLEKHLGEKDIFVRESSRLKQQNEKVSNKMTRSEYQEQVAFLEMNIKQQNEKISKVQKELASMSNDFMDSTEIMQKVSTTPYEKLPHLIQASFELCVEYAEQNRSKKQTGASDLFEQRTKSSVLLDGIKQARSDFYKQQTSSQSPAIESKDINSYSLNGSGGSISNNNSNSNTPTMSGAVTIGSKLKEMPPISSSTNVNNSKQSNSSFAPSKQPTSLAPPPAATSAATASSFSTADFIKEIELLQQQIRQSSLNFAPPAQTTSTTTTTTTTSDTSSPASFIDGELEDDNLNFSPLLNIPKSTNTTSFSTITVTGSENNNNNNNLTSPTTTSTKNNQSQPKSSTVESKVDQLLDEIKSAKERSNPAKLIGSNGRPKTRKNSSPASGNMSTSLTINSILNGEGNSGFSNNNNSNMSISLEPTFDNNILDVDMDLMKKPNNISPKSTTRKQLQNSGDNVVLSPNSASAYLAMDGDVFARLSAPRPDSRLRRYRDKLKTDNYRTAILQTRRQELSGETETFIKFNWSFTGHEGSVLGLLFNDQSQQLYSCGQDKLIKAWDLVSGDCVSDLTGHSAAVKAMAYHPATGMLFSGGGSDRLVRVWDMRTAQSGVVQSIKVQNELLCMTAQGHYIFGGLENQTIKVWDTRQLRPVKTPLAKRENLSGSIFAMTFSSKHFITGSRDHSVTLYHKDTLEMVQRLQPNHLDGVNALAVGADDIVYSGSRDKTIKRWEPTVAGTYQQQSRPTNTIHQDWVTSLTTHNSLLFSGCRDATIKGWDSQLNANTMHLLGHESSVNCIISTGNVLLSGSSDRSIKLWKV